jgi:hypothetical protein
VAPAELLPAAEPASRQHHGRTPARVLRRLPVPLTHLLLAAKDAYRVSRANKRW